MKIFQSTELSRDPVAQMEATTKQYVDNMIVSGAVVGGLFFTNVTPTSGGIVGSKTYVPGTTPASKVILTAASDTDNVTVVLFAEGGSTFYSPTVTIETIPPQAGGPIVATLVEDTFDKRSYIASAVLTGITVDTIVNAVSSTNASAQCMITRAQVGPAFDVLVIGALPGTQTEVKAGDVLPINGRAPNSAVYAEIIAGGAAASVTSITLGAADSYSPGYKSLSGTFVVGAGTGVQSIQARARNALGTYGTTNTSVNTVVLNQTYPTIGSRLISYPGVQTALKGLESAIVTATVTNFDTILYTGVNVTIAAPSTYSSSKTVTRSGGTYSVGVQNYTITANKASNNATSTASSAISIADVAPTAAITISGNPTRLLSSPAGVDYTIVITATQQLQSPPVLVASSGTFLGSWTGSGTTWSRTLRISDTDLKGAQSFTGLSITGLSSITGTTITSGSTYTVGGFINRSVTFPAFARYAPIGTSVQTISKVTASYTGGTVLARQPNTSDVFQGFTIVDSAGNYDPFGDHLFISDAAFAAANTSGTLQLDISEAV